jgi:hypothetical protein
MAWAQDRSLSANAGRQLLDALYAKLDPADQAIRESAFAQAREYIEIALQAHGVRAPTKKSFPRKPNKYKERVDLEVHAGIAFFPEAYESE